MQLTFLEKKTFVTIIALIVGTIGFSQKNYINDDGTVSTEYKRTVFLESLKENETELTRYDIEKDYFVIISKQDCGNEKYSSEEMQSKAFYSSMIQLKERITNLKLSGLELFEELDFKGLIFKTNIICMHETRRYHYQFDLTEIQNFPEYIDIGELIEYLTVKNKNDNIIYSRNPKD